ncbi:MAG TPA: tripartite tricarboxylate transporter substrate binding protein, partial [Xanthobacteraceae bacterium]|nr:tripartite tricarboxylate transporter substrate binding protein [Xanthobacteraceae bacterium]
RKGGRTKPGGPGHRRSFNARYARIELVGCAGTTIGGVAMRFSHRRFLRRAAGASALAVLSLLALSPTSRNASSQSRTIKIVNPFPPGGTADIIARVLADQISRTQSVTMLIEDRPGAGTVIGTELAARATPDGNTLLITTSALVINAHLRKVTYKPLASFDPICNLAQSPQLVVVNSASPYRTIADLVSAARAMPGQLSLASTGPATSAQIAFEMLKRVANVEMTFVPFPGNAPTVNAILGGHVTSAVANYADLVEHLKAGKLRALATFTPARIEPLPELPTIAESGYKESEYVTWFGMFAPANTPKEVISQLSGWFAAALQVPEVKAKLVIQGLYPVGACGSAFGELVRKQYDDFGRIILEANIKAE